MLQPQVSVVTTVYNGQPHFSRAVPSILAQDYRDFEFIIVDDGSTDDTPEFLADLERQDPRVRVLSPGRLGRAKALNYGVSQARGEYIALQDFDDISYPQRLRVQVDWLDSHPRVGAVGGFYVLVDDNRDERYVRQPPVEHESILRAIPKYIPLCHTLVTFRKRAWVEAGFYPEVQDIEDLRLWIRFVEVGWRLANVPANLGEHWVHASSFWHRSFSYRKRQATLRKVQREAIGRLGLPFWMHVYPLSRLLYGFLPPWLKRVSRRRLVNLNEVNAHLANTSKERPSGKQTT